MRWLAVLVAVAGCNRILGLEPTLEVDAYVAPGCSGARFTGPFPFTSLTADDIFDPSQGEDPLELMVTLRVQDVGFRMQRATRPDTASSFTIRELPFAEMQYLDNDPSITAHGQRLLFNSNRTQDHQLWEAMRTPDGTFDNPAIVSSIPPFDQGFDASIDGLTIYFGDENVMPGIDRFPLYTASRPDLDSAFGEPTQLVDDNVSFPAISPDQLEVFYHSPHDDRIYRRVRPAIDEPFGPEEPVAAAGSVDPDVSPDARTLLFADRTTGHLLYMTRDCP